MRRFLIKFGVLVAVIYLICLVIDWVITREFLKSEYYKPLWANHIKNQQFDFVFLGNSRVYRIVDVESLSADTGLNGLNLGLDGSNLASQLLLLRLFYANKNTTQRVILQVDPVVFNSSDNDAFAAYNFMPLLNQSIVFEHFRKIDPIYYAYRFVPLIRYAKFNFNWGIENLIRNRTDSWKGPFDPTGTYIINDKGFHGDSLQYFDSQLKHENTALRSIISFCNENNIDLTLFTAPYIDYDEQSKGIMKLFDQKMRLVGKPYFNYHNLFQSNYNMFYDNNHINYEGSKVLTSELKTLLNTGKDSNTTNSQL